MSPVGGIITALTTKMGDRLANIAMETEASNQEHASSEQGVFTQASAFLNNDVNHWLESSQTAQHELQGPALTPKNLILSRHETARRRSVFRGLVLLGR